MRVSVIVPALNEAECIGPLLAELSPAGSRQVIVVDNGSTDATGGVARAAGAQVVWEPRPGYGYACAAGVAAAKGDVLVFIDGDGSFVPGEIPTLLAPLESGQADLVLGARRLERLSAEVMPPHQRYGNQWVARLLSWQYRIHLTDLGPFRAVNRAVLETLAMQERTYGWPVEMMVKAARRRLWIVEVPVTYRPRLAGKSKVGGSLRGTVLTTYRIFRVLVRHSFGIE
jgi:glycosyltransferase involved in cell wall biosynthesis